MSETGENGPTADEHAGDVPSQEIESNLDLAERNKKRIVELFKSEHKLTDGDIQETIESQDKFIPFVVARFEPEFSFGIWFIKFMSNDRENAKLFIFDNLDPEYENDSKDNIWQEIVRIYESSDSIERKTEFISKLLEHEAFGEKEAEDEKIRKHFSRGENWIRALNGSGINKVFLKYRTTEGDQYEAEADWRARRFEKTRKLDWQWLQDVVFLKYLEKHDSGMIAQEIKKVDEEVSTSKVYRSREENLPGVSNKLFSGEQAIESADESVVSKSLELISTLMWSEFFKYNQTKSQYKPPEDWAKYQDGIIRSYGFSYSHTLPGTWFLLETLKNNHDKILDNIDLISLDNPRKTMIALADKKVAKDLKLAEVAGEAYARLFAFLGGESTYWVGDKVAKVKPANIEECKSYADKNKLLEDYILSEDVSESIETPTGAFCTPNTYQAAFEKNTYDIFMAVNHGNAFTGEQINPLTELILKPKRNINLDWWVNHTEGASYSIVE